MLLSGIGPLTALIIHGYIGNVERFSNPKQVSYYAGLVPRVDISGNSEKHCSIIKRGCRQLRRVLIQCVWALIRSKYGGDLRNKYQDLKKEKTVVKPLLLLQEKCLN